MSLHCDVIGGCGYRRNGPRVKTTTNFSLSSWLWRAVTRLSNELHMQFSFVRWRFGPRRSFVTLSSPLSVLSTSLKAPWFALPVHDVHQNTLRASLRPWERGKNLKQKLLKQLKGTFIYCWFCRLGSCLRTLICLVCAFIFEAVFKTPWCHASMCGYVR